jgi:hypothetical protein
MVDLSSNRIKNLLPSGCHLQYQSLIPNIVSLNISDNPLKNVRESADQIQALMPNMIDLQMSLFDEADVDYIITAMP